MIFLLKRSLTILKTCSLRLIPYFPFSKPKIKSGENLVFTSLKQIQFIKNLIFYSKKRILFSEYSLSLKFKIFL
ncbi:Uncharacterized protein NV38_0001261, partial [Leptospira kirschneri serovar Mozdok]